VREQTTMDIGTEQRNVLAVRRTGSCSSDSQSKSTELGCIRGQDATRKRRVADEGKPRIGKRCSFLGAHLDLIFCVDFPQCLAYCYPRRLRRNTRGNQSKVPVSVLSITPADLSILGFSGFGTIAVRIYSSNTVHSQSWKSRFRKAVKKPL
jgi:hypothetical protein